MALIMKLRDYFFLSRENRTFTCKKEEPRKGQKKSKCGYAVIMAFKATTNNPQVTKYTFPTRKAAKEKLIALILWHTSMKRSEIEKL